MDAVEVPFALVYERLPAGVLIVDLTGRVVHANAAARSYLGPALRDGVRCCDLFGCRAGGGPAEGGCVTERALALAGPTPEVRVDVPLDEDIRAPACVSAAAIGGVEAAVAIQVRAAAPAERLPAPRAGTERPLLRVEALGPMRLAAGTTPVGGDWLAHRPGQLFKYLVAERGRTVPVEELLEALWRDHPRAGATNVRQAVHALRDRLEPQRAKHRPPAFVVARRGGYALETEHIDVDADRFEAAAREGLGAVSARRPAEAEAALDRAAAIYRGDFLADDPYADWAATERERLRDLATQALRTLAGLRLDRDAGPAAVQPLQRLAELEPFDDRAQRELLEQLLRLGRHAEAQRRYQLVSRRFRRAFGTVPEWGLAELLDV